MKDDVLYYLAFSHFLGIGPMRFVSLMSRFGDVEKAYNASKEDLTDLLGNNQAEKFVAFRNTFDPVKKLEELTRKEIQVIPLMMRSHPKSLLQISDPPICLYVKGDFNAYNFEKQYFFAIVGTRKPTAYGIQVTKKFAADLAESGFIIVSGMAMGIDTAAHETTLAVGGKTIAVLGCGVDIVYPAVNRRLYENIIKNGGLVISEFPPGQMVMKGLFIARNRIISGLSIGVLVIEGAKDSGALITARYGGEQGKQVFAPPGPLTSEMSEAPNSLLKKGAKLVTSIDDILEEFNLKLVPKKKEEMEAELQDEEKIIFNFLRNEPRLIDEIKNSAKAPIEKILNVLSILEIKGIVEKNSEGKYQIKM